ncbi:MAG TPA: ComEC/Rec2 family competence protein [Vitreimonas sp.]|uniref:ComEC/Rec2 family competence protein n=1 Tax=Vitreimonas sp. TaxID=3069702 RepID=UPI002D700A4F|nr:ComEC/Rec2 family competence protein [Vitreimonas sp.]HYD87501.1 ComEC/Rec2 family competence protein [Vitreimonas sp.]
MIALQRDRWILWLPVGMIAGAAAWMLAPLEPPAWLGGALLAAGVVVAFGLAAWPGEQWESWLLACRRILAGLFALLAATGLGALAAQVRAASVAQPVFAAGEEPIRVEGWVIANDASDNGPRLRLLVRNIEGIDAPPRYVRLSVSAAGLLTPGRAARCRGVLGPPSGPMSPGGYDFARRAYFERLGATGFAFGRCRPAALEPPPNWLDRQRLQLAALRSDLAAAIYEAAPGRGGAIAAALVTGDRSSIGADTNAALRDSGLGHLLSVSGIHMGVVGGLVFAILLWTLSLIGPIALRFPVKKIAAAGALLVLAAYLIVSGSSVPALRSFVMACVAFGAILLDRPAISMRGLALAAFIVVLIFPESVLEPGFQMSFAATMALVALFEMLKRAPHEPALPTPGPIIGLLQATTRGISGVLLISFVAGLATDPFAIYHFQRFALYSLPANLIAAPIMSFLVAPMAAAAAILAPFGLADPALELMASALDLIAAVGQTFGERPEAVRAVPQPPHGAFLICVLALLWACLWRGALRWLAAPMLAASVALYVTAPKPALAFDADLRAVYARDGERWALLASRGRSTFARDRLGSMLGLSPAEIERLAPPEACGDALCRWRSPIGDIFVVRDAAHLPNACVERAIVITDVQAPEGFAARCRLSVLMDASSLAAHGGATVTQTPLGLRIERARPGHIRRAWTVVASGDDQE